MTPPTYLYIRIYWGENKIVIYTGITTDMVRRQREHNMNLSKTTMRYAKAYTLKEIRYKEQPAHIAKRYEKTFKRYGTMKKLKMSHNWKRWAG